MKPLNILIRGGGWVNKGGEAMLCTAREQLASRLPGARFFAGLPPNADSYGASARFSPLGALQENPTGRARLLAKALLRGPRLLAPLLSDRWATVQALASLERVDAVLDVSGFAYSDEWGSSYASRTWTYAYCATKLSKPYIFLPQAWGPFENPAVARLSREMIQWSPLVCVRDPQSLSHVERLLHGLGPQVRAAPDIAFHFLSEPREVGQALLRSLGVGREGAPLLGIAPNMRVYERTRGQGAENLYVQLMAEVIRWAWGVGAAVVLIPHEISFAKDPQDDRFLCRIIKDAAGAGGPLAVLDGMHPAGEIKAVIGCVDMLVGSRFHSIVAALSCRVPPVVLGWSHKYLELMRSVGLEEQVLDYEQSESSRLLGRIETAWEQRGELRRQLEVRLPAVEDEVGALFDAVAELIGGVGR